MDVYQTCVLLSILIVWLLSFGKSSHICKGVGEEIVKDRLGTKTSYSNAFKQKSFWTQFESEIWGCTVKQIWFLARHGTRYPVAKEYRGLAMLPRISEEIVYNHYQGRGCLSEEDVELLRNWIPPYSLNDRGQLHETGADELFEMGEYWQKLFPSIFQGPYDSSEYKVEFTVKNRTGQSAYHFLRGVFGDDAIARIELPVPASPNFVLRFYDSCPLWLNEVHKNNQTTYKERLLFQGSSEFQSVVHAVSGRLGYMYPLPVAEVLAIYDECRYEVAWRPTHHSVWCQPFSQHDMKIMEYHQDLKYYYEDSYGTPMNAEMACRTVGDLFQTFRFTVSAEEGRPKAVLYFSHDKTLTKFYSLMGLFRPSEHLRHDNFNIDEERAFNSSHVTPFGTNIAFVLYRCSLGHKVAAFFQGYPIPIPHLCQQLVCDWEELLPFFEEIHGSCDLSRICMLHDEL